MIGNASGKSLEKEQRQPRGETVDRSSRQPFAPSQQPIRRQQAVQTALQAVFFGSGYAALYFIDCELEGDRLVLSGQVPSYHLKQLAQVLAQRVDGIERIDNRLEVFRRFQGQGGW